jgi:pimeloyl-ACP methyl ester carboxylesterase
MVPTLILAPSNSAATNVEEQKKIADKIKGSRLEIVEGPGHEIYVTEGGKCQAVFLDFLESLGKGRATH